jgi:hypothetical protein
MIYIVMDKLISYGSSFFIVSIMAASLNDPQISNKTLRICLLYIIKMSIITFPCIIFSNCAYVLLPDKTEWASLYYYKLYFPLQHTTGSLTFRASFN